MLNSLNACRTFRVCRKRFCLIFICLLWTGLSELSAQTPGNNVKNTHWLKGYARDIKGETLDYHSPQDNVNKSLLVRSLDAKLHIAWETQPVPASFTADTAIFVFLAGIDANTDSHRFDLYIQEQKVLSFSNPVDTLRKSLEYSGKAGVRLHFRVTMVDRYEDLMGYMFLKVPVDLLIPGKPLALKVVGESAGSRSWFMVFKHGFDPQVTFTPMPAVIDSSGKPYQLVKADLVHFGKPVSITVESNNQVNQKNLRLGQNIFYLAFPAVEGPEDLTLTYQKEKEAPQKKAITLFPVAPHTIHLLHHTHLDIGYTHLQDEVEKMQWDHIEKSIMYGRKTQHYPEGAQFRWNVESMWAVDTYLEQASETQKDAFIEAVQKGWIELDALYANELTALCRPEELFRLTAPARRIAEVTGVPIDAEMISDIPGYTWGLVPALAHAGVRYISMGTNTFHRIGHIIEEWGDRPFYWVSPSGKHRVLAWVAGKGYSMFHTGLGYTKLKNKLNRKNIFTYLEDLHQQRYPYDMSQLRYCIGSDNGPPDPNLLDIVRSWNETYITPKLHISTTSRMFRAFEKQYAPELPVVRGDFTGYWEDGAYSSAKETIINRASAEKLVQAEILWSLMDPENFPYRAFEKAWQQVLLYDEHTWGAYNSISEPESPFVTQQWEVKKGFALRGKQLSDSLLKAVLPAPAKTSDPLTVDIYNTHSWARKDWVTIPSSWLQGNVIQQVTDEQGNLLTYQRLQNGDLLLETPHIQPLSAARLRITSTRSNVLDGFYTKPPSGTIQAGPYRVILDTITGAIKSLQHAPTHREWVDTTHFIGLNQYLYVAGRDPVSPQTVEQTNISLREQGPLVSTYVIRSKPPGADKMETEITFYISSDRIDITHTVYKTKIFDPEGVHFAFPFHIPEGQTRIDLAWGIFTPEKEQLKGSNKNYFTAQRWVDVSNDSFGITLALPDAALLETGRIMADPIAMGWQEGVESSQTILSYVMNNYWETNFLAAQEGKIQFRYSLLPHGPFDPATAKRSGIERSQPLIPVKADPAQPVFKAPFSLVSPNIMVTSIRPIDQGKALLLRLFNAGPENEVVRFTGEDIDQTRLFISNLAGERVMPWPKDQSMVPMKIVMVRMAVE